MSKPKVNPEPHNRQTSKESKAARFERMAPPRVRRVLKGLRLLGNCANHGSYEYTGQQVAQMFEAINQSVEAIRVRYNQVGKDTEPEFDF